MKIATHPEVKIDNSKEDELTMICGNTIIKGDSFDNFYLVQEIFMDGVYNFFLKEKEVAVIDVGMNVGLASLFFAGKPFVQKVYSFEPFPSTYQRALQNLDLNPTLKQKIVPHNAGVDGADAVLKIPVVVGESALGTTSDFLMEHLEIDQSKTVTVQIRDIKTILRDVFKAHESLPVILKLDCEGAEYEIMRQMNETGLIKRISVIVIEWHMKGYQSLVDILVANDYSTTVFPRPNAVMYDIGLIYAVNTKVQGL
jgi:FkbM family methyltransferase